MSSIIKSSLKVETIKLEKRLHGPNWGPAKNRSKMHFRSFFCKTVNHASKMFLNHQPWFWFKNTHVWNCLKINLRVAFLVEYDGPKNLDLSPCFIPLPFLELPKKTSSIPSPPSNFQRIDGAWTMNMYMMCTLCDAKNYPFESLLPNTRNQFHVSLLLALKCIMK